MIQLPASKSIGARYLVITYFAGTLPADPLFQDNEDLRLLQEALLAVYSDEEPIDYGDTPLDVGASGTGMRFLAAVCASSPGADYVITGTPRLMERPMAPLVNLLNEAGAEIEILGENGCGPYRVKGRKIAGGDFYIPGDVSSQLVSALMLASPSWEKGINLSFTTPLVSRPYVEMTSRIMKNFGVEVFLDDDGVEVRPGNYVDSESFSVESDWSSAAFFYEAASIGKLKIGIENLTKPFESLQGDAVVADIFRSLGVSSEFIKEGALVEGGNEFKEKLELSFRDYPDLFLPVSLACLCSNVRFKFTDISHLRLKESDRIKSLEEEGLKLGFKIHAEENFVEWNGETVYPSDPIEIDPHDDHRVAMAFSMAVFKSGEIRIRNPRVVEKSFPDFWNQLATLGVDCEQSEDIITLRYKK